MAKVIGKLAAPRGKYIKEGEEKTSWGIHGIVLKTDKGLRVKLESLPLGGAGEDGIWFSVFEEKPKQEEGFRDNKPAQGGFEDDDIAF